MVGNTHQHLRPWNHTLATLFWWEIGTTKKWSPVGQTKDIERPTARLLDHLYRFHVDLIHIRTLFAVHFHTDEVLIHQLGNIVTLKTLMRHHMTPVAGRIADRNQQWLTRGFGSGEGLFAPWIPIHWVVGMLFEIKAILLGESIWHLARVRSFKENGQFPTRNLSERMGDFV